MVQKNKAFHIKSNSFMENWTNFIEKEKTKDYFVRLNNFLVEERKNYDIFPAEDNVFRAFKLCPPDNIRVVIVGQDPYPTPGNANGLAFSVPEGVKPAASLKNIFKEISYEFNKENTLLYIRQNGDLTDWAKQGVFLLNTVLTVRSGEPESHRKKGWETFTDEVLKQINLIDRPIVFMLWGNDARKKADLIDNPNHLILMAAHPSPLSANRGFFGCGCFKTANDFLAIKGIEPIKWT